MQFSVRKHGDTATIALAGRFDCHTVAGFRAGYAPLVADPVLHELRLDLEGVEYLDSTALGAILALRGEAAVERKSVVLANCVGAVRQVLECAHFPKLFVMA